MYWKNAVRSWREQERRYRYLGKVGRLVSWTRVHTAPESFGGRCGYVVGIVEMKNGERAMGEVVGVSQYHGDTVSLRVGERVEGVLRRLYEDGKDGVISYGTKFRKIVKRKT